MHKTNQIIIYACNNYIWISLIMSNILQNIKFLFTLEHIKMIAYSANT